MLSEKPFTDLLGETNRILQEGLNKGITDNMPSDEMLQKLQKDVFVFSGCKTHIELKEVSAMLLDENEKIKSYQKFSQDVAGVGKLYNENYLRVEHQFAIGSAEMAGKWAGFDQEGERYNLQYRTANDGRVREEHFALHNTTLPINDPFWNSYYPPNGWGCRCTVVEVLKDKYPQDVSAEAEKKGLQATQQIGKDGRDRGAMFRFNPGKQQVIFPPNHPYRKVQDTISGMIGTIFSSWNNGGFRVVKTYKNGGSLSVHRQVQVKANDYKDIELSANYFAKKGDQVNITPKVHYKDPLYNDIYGVLKGTKYYGKCPDFSVNSKIYEVEGWVSKKNALNKMLSRGIKQSDRIIIKDDGSSLRYIKKIVHQRIMEGQTINELWILKDNGDVIRIL